MELNITFVRDFSFMKFFKKYLKWYYSKKYPAMKMDIHNPEYLGKMASIFIGVTFVYRPLTEGLAIVHFHHKNADDLFNRTVQCIQLIENDSNFPKLSFVKKKYTLDNWLTTDNNIPIEINQFLIEYIPALNRLCHILNKSTEAQSNAYFLRQSSKVLHDANAFLDVLFDLTT